MKKIEKLTPKQEQYLPVFREKYFKLATSPKRIDRAKLEAGISDVYAVIEKEKPMVVILQSPLQAMMAIRFFEVLGKEDLGDQLRGQLRGQPLWNSNFLWGSQDLYWVAWARFAQHIGVKLGGDTEHRLSIMEGISSQCEWWWPYEGICFVSEKPVETKWDGLVLHSETAPAVEYEDGYSMYVWRGTRVPEEWIKDKSSLTPDMAITWDNIEQRRCIAEILGWHKNALPAIEAMHQENEQLRQALTLILPLAKGYAHKNKVGSNQEYIEFAEAALKGGEKP